MKPGQFSSKTQTLIDPSLLRLPKRRRTTTTSSASSNTPPPLTSPPPKTLKTSTTTTTTSRRSLFIGQWIPLGIPPSELSLPLTLPTGQTFRWRRTSPDRFTGVVGPHLLSLRQPSPDSPVSYLLHSSAEASSSAEAAIADYLNLSISLGEVWSGFAERDARFAEAAGRVGEGARVLRQDPWECAMQFLCSSNNNIGRIERMVGTLSSFGEYLGTVRGHGFYRFPSVERLAEVSEEELRRAGFGYRAKYIVGAVKLLQSKPEGGEKWLTSLRGLELPEVIDALCTLPGVGPKVAACIALFSLDQHHAIPVDTHVWQIATRYLIPELAGARLTPKLSKDVAEAFVKKYGKYAGWAQTVLFIGELPSHKATDISNCSIEEMKSAKRKRVKVIQSRG
ncbi:N-glycosylase/DNA lyase OGG1 [Acorus gramineus]|uniref:DNA-(apurinic or apyrimidinic site) lyase n=1 Tax=Acorus gramineus TaxID=55184 RepID=A0AAV9ARY2_ACOGR|nr:N-glycosylase/DNA lyase OGG1 [Acorus gramineus]